MSMDKAENRLYVTKAIERGEMQHAQYESAALAQR